MPVFSANLSMLFREVPFIERFAAARTAGFTHVECWFPYDTPAKVLRTVLSDNGLKMVGINSPSGGEGDWGIAALPGRQEEFRRSIHLATDYAAELGASVHVMAGLTEGIARTDAASAYFENLRYALNVASGPDVQLLIEPLNSRDRPGYFLSSVEQAASIIAQQDLAGLRMMFDIYHVQLQSGNIIGNLRRYFEMIGHIQVASVPDRHEPDVGELSYDAIFEELCLLGWTAPIGAEYIPRQGTQEGLAWFSRWSKEQGPTASAA